MIGTVWVTGAGSGIGAAFVRAFSAAGHGVALTGRNRDSLDETASSLPEGARCLVVPGDVTDRDGMADAAREVADWGAEHDRVRRMFANLQQARKRVRVIHDLERYLEGRENFALFAEAVDEQRDAWALGFELLGDWVAVLAKEIEDVRAAETEMSPGSPEVRDLAAVGPVVDGLQIDLAEARDLRCCEEPLGLVRVGRHLS